MLFTAEGTGLWINKSYLTTLVNKNCTLIEPKAIFPPINYNVHLLMYLVRLFLYKLWHPAESKKNEAVCCIDLNGIFLSLFKIYHHGAV